MGQALLIKSSAGKKESVQGAWHLFEQATPYIQGIETGDLAENVNAGVLNRMISGLPSVWSRARVFGYAFKYTRKDANIETSGLIKFYDVLVNEWKGLLALLALFPGRISLSEPLLLDPANQNQLYDIPHAFGRMLFEDADLWCNPQAVDQDKKLKPFVQLIYYNNILIGATSPYTLVFTGIDYDNLPESSDIPWYRNGKFDDPMKYGQLSNDQIQKLYLLVNNIEKKLPDFERSINTHREGKETLNLAPLLIFVQNWKAELSALNPDLVDEGALDADLSFAMPYQPLFKVKQDIYYQNGLFSFNNADGQAIDLQKILLQDDFIYSISEVDDQQPLAESAVYYLKALDPENTSKIWHFPIPLSAYGLALFKNQVVDMVQNPGRDTHELRATFKANAFKLVIELFLKVDGQRQTPITKEYDIKIFTGTQRNVIMWPNFISKDWNSYFLYSEYPSNSHDIKFVPFFKDYSQLGGFDSGEFMLNREGSLIYPDQDTENSGLKVEHLVKYPINIATSDHYPYEIFRANRPFGGIEIRSLINGKDRVCGYLIVKKAHDDSMLGKKIIDLSHESNFEEAVVGIDFGSNNSCVSYSLLNRSETTPITFENRRVFLHGAEVRDPKHEKIAERHELLFFQNESTANGQIKSRVHEHDTNYIPAGYDQEEIAGGVPVFEYNLLIHNVSKDSITTNAGKLHYNMKWLSDETGRQKKEAYLKTVWLKVVADLYARKILPAELRWSYPGAFSQFDKLQYQQIYNKMSDIPVADKTVAVTQAPSTESEAVCNYALTKGGLSDNNLLLGIDVGGSTSDVLIVSMDRAAQAFKLAKQSSLRLAASFLSDATLRSKAFCQAIYHYHESPSCQIKVANMNKIVEESDRGPFYLNAILDRLDDKDFQSFYSALSQKVPEVFALPAYITGLLLFYSGQLVAKTIQENNYNNVRTIDLMPFGKGGRLFDWLDSYPGKAAAADYYSRCFKTGFGQGSEAVSLVKKDSIRIDNKSEVAKGLSAPQKVEVDEDARANSDIIGEEGYRFYPKGSKESIELKAEEAVREQYLEEMDFGIAIPTEFVEFNKFMAVFFDFVGQGKTGIIRNTANISRYQDQFSNELKNYITNDPEWQKAYQQKAGGQEFSFKHSFLVLQALCFLERYLIPELYK